MSVLLMIGACTDTSSASAIGRGGPSDVCHAVSCDMCHGRMSVASMGPERCSTPSRCGRRPTASLPDCGKAHDIQAAMTCGVDCARGATPWESFGDPIGDPSRAFQCSRAPEEGVDVRSTARKLQRIDAHAGDFRVDERGLCWESFGDLIEDLLRVPGCERSEVQAGDPRLGVHYAHEFTSGLQIHMPFPTDFAVASSLGRIVRSHCPSRSRLESCPFLK